MAGSIERNRCDIYYRPLVNESNDPLGERDFGSFEYKGNRVFWKIDYHDPTMRFASTDPTDPTQTVRVLTIMLAEEY